METMNLLDITIKYFNVIVFVLFVIFGMISLFASWIAWREIHRKNNIIRSVLAAYNIAEDTLEKGRTSEGDLQLDPAIVETVFNSLQEILNAVYGEVTGKPIPARDDRTHGSIKVLPGIAKRKIRKRKDIAEALNMETAVPGFIPQEGQHRQHIYHP